MDKNRLINPWASWTGTPGTRATGRLPKPLADTKMLIRPDSLAAAFCLAGRRLGATDFTVARLDSGASIWARVFQKEPAYLLSELLSFNSEDAAFAFEEALERMPQVACIQVAKLANTIKAWVIRIEHDKPDVFSKQLQQLNRQANLSRLLIDFAGVDVRTALNRAEEKALERASIKSDDVIGLANATREALRAIHTTLRNAVTTLKPEAQKAFDARIVSGEMDPGLGLLIAELRTAAHVDTQFNELISRHTELYYQNIIGQHPAAVGAERVLLDLGDSKSVDRIPHKATLEALLPNGKVQHFETDGAVPLNPAKITDIRVLSYETDRKVSLNAALDGITRVRAAKIETGVTLNPRSVFSSGTTQPLQMGLDITSPMLALAEGTRRIDLKLHMARSSHLPPRPRPLTKKERADREARWIKAAQKGRTSPNLTSDLSQDPHHIDPEVRQSFSSDPDMLVTFFGDAKPRTIEQHAYEITQLASDQNETPSLSRLYEYLVHKVKTDAQLRLILGRILTLSMLESIPFPSGAYWQKLQTLIRAHKLFNGADRSMVFAAFANSPRDKPTDSPEDIFQSLLGDALDLTISTEDGPRRPDMMQITPLNKPNVSGGILISMRYNASAPALVGTRQTQEPLLQLRYATTPRVCPISFFERYAISSIGIDIQVKGLRKLSGYNDDAPVVTDQTFQPFGPRPDDGATFIVGSPELARKPVTAVGVSLKWTDMPPETGGFKAHYAAYPDTAQLPDPKLKLEYLSGDGWKPVSKSAQSFFQTDGVTGTFLPEWTYNGGVSGHSIPADGQVTKDEFKSRQSIRAGAIRITLTGTGGAFNTDLYSLALVKAMRPNYVPFRTRPQPRAPFVPTIADFSISYCASSTIELNAQDSNNTGERVTQISPFGAAEIYPQRVLRQARLFPKRLGFGELYLQIETTRGTGPMTILFETSKIGHLRTLPDPNPIRWHYLSSNGWRELPETALTSDTTDGLMRAGLVQIDLPQDAARPTTEMPSGGSWIAAVATRPKLSTFPALQHIKIGGVWARQIDETPHATGEPRTWTFSPAQRGVSTIAEIATPRAVRPPEAIPDFTARVSERLRHRKRAVTSWDIERLLLEEFPETWMAKCFPHLSSRDAAPKPGHLTIVAVRSAPLDKNVPHAEPSLFDIATLGRMREFIQCHTSGFTEIEAVNPTFERLQVRAQITVDPQREDGAMAQLLNNEITSYLSTWSAPPALGRFGWRLNEQLLRAHLMQLSYIKNISEFSILHLSGDDKAKFELNDTAQDNRDRRGAYGPILRPRFPWALPLSAKDHHLNLINDLTDHKPTPAGIGSLGVGEMLIVGQRTRS